MSHAHTGTAFASGPADAAGGLDPAARSGYADHPPRMGFFTDTSVCIGCKACEVACKEWNSVPEDGLELTGMSYDNTQGLGADTWRHVAFIEQRKPLGGQEPGVGHQDLDVFDAARHLGTSPSSPGPGATVPPPGSAPAGAPSGAVSPVSPDGRTELRWLMASDVCKHCTHAACLDVCPTGSLFRTEFGTVVVQEDICNGCGYCVPACPFGVIDKRHLARKPDDEPLALPLLGKKEDGRVWKCTLCYDRLKGGHEPACAKACPTDSIQFGELDELRERAHERLEKLETNGWNGARLYGHDATDGVGGFGAFFLLLDEPEVYGLPPDPVVTTKHLPEMWKTAAVATGALVLGVVAGFLGGSR